MQCFVDHYLSFFKPVHSVLLLFTASDYPFAVFKLFLAVPASVVEPSTHITIMHHIFSLNADSLLIIS
jgi:hypothetical protein